MPPRRSASGSEGQSIRLAPTNADPLASLRICKVAVSLAGRVWLIPAHDAAVWLEILLDEQLDPEAVFPGLCGPQVVVEVNRLLLDGVVTEADMEEAICDAIEAASGRKWWMTLRLCRFLRDNWDRIGGELAANGVTPFGVSLSYWLDGAYATAIRLMLDGDPRQAAKFTAQLTAPLPGRAKESFDLARNQAAFRAAMAQARSR